MGWQPRDPYLQSCLRIQDKKQTISAHDKAGSAVLEQLPGRQACPWTRLDTSPGLMSDIQISTWTDSEVTSGRKLMPRRLCFPPDICLYLLHPFLSKAAPGRHLSEKSNLRERVQDGGPGPP